MSTVQIAYVVVRVVRGRIVEVCPESGLLLLLLLRLPSLPFHLEQLLLCRDQFVLREFHVRVVGEAAQNLPSFRVVLVELQDRLVDVLQHFGDLNVLVGVERRGIAQAGLPRRIPVVLRNVTPIGRGRPLVFGCGHCLLN